MSRRCGIRSLPVLAALALLPAVALAEVSVQLDARGQYRRYYYLTIPGGRTPRIWAQVRPRLPQHFVLNPLGDTYGDLAPVIQTSPVTGYPFVVWPKNLGNIKQLAYSTWDGAKWTEPALVIPGAALVYDDREPSLALDAGGSPFLVWSRAEQIPKIYFSTLIAGRFSPAVLLSDPEVPSWSPAITLLGTTAVVTYLTPSGPVTKTYETAVLIDSAASLMDNPIPPLNTPPTDPSGGLPSGGDGNQRKK